MWWQLEMDMKCCELKRLPLKIFSSWLLVTLMASLVSASQDFWISWKRWACWGWGSVFLRVKAAPAPGLEFWWQGTRVKHSSAVAPCPVQFSFTKGIAHKRHPCHLIEKTVLIFLSLFLSICRKGFFLKKRKTYLTRMLLDSLFMKREGADMGKQRVLRQCA